MNYETVLRDLNKGQLRTLFANLAHCSFKTPGVLEFGGGDDFLTGFYPLFVQFINYMFCILFFNVTIRLKFVFDK